MNNTFSSVSISDMLVLFVIGQKDSYAYDIITAIKSYSDGMIEIPQNTVYTVAYRLEAEGKISSYSKLVGKRRTRVYYHIEPQGEIYLKKLLKSYKETAEGITKVLSSVEGSE